jgi:hypothetical protein
MKKIQVMPEDHFTEDQINAIRGLFTQQVNSLFIKVIAGNLVALIVLVGSLFVGWYRLGDVEKQVAVVGKAISEGPRFTQEEGDALRSAMSQRDEDLQRQIDALKNDQAYIRARVDQIYNILR